MNEERIAELESEVQELQNVIKDKDREIENLEDDITKLEYKIDDLEKELKEKDGEIDDLESEIEEWQSSCYEKETLSISDAGIGIIYWRTDNLKLQQIMEEFLSQTLPTLL